MYTIITEVVTENPNHEWNRDPGTSSFGPLEPQILSKR